MRMKLTSLTWVETAGGGTVVPILSGSTNVMLSALLTAKWVLIE